MRILLITTRFPLPPWRGQQVRTVEWLEALADHERMLICPEPTGTEGPAELRANGIDLRFWPGSFLPRIPAALSGVLRGRPLQESLYATAGARETARSAMREFNPDVAVVQMVRCAWAVDIVENMSPGVPVVFDAVDSMGLHFENAAADMPRPLRFPARIEAMRCRDLEVDLSGRAAVTTAVAQRDLDALGVPEGKGLVVPVAGREPRIARNPSATPSILLSGNLGYRPTVEAALWFADEVWPGIRESIPSARWVLAGARPSRKIRRLSSLPGVEVHADVPDLGPFFAESWVAVAPMETGSGVPMKVLEAWAAGLPVVAHPWTARGLVEEGRDAVRQAHEVEEWVEAITGLLGDEGARTDLAAAGRVAWDRSYRPERIAQRIREAVSRAGSY
ncbi:MAG: glycosyltransferase family 4 protein [Thermoanaerobaculales bacterium]|nr:glycosyltransferase family 4 protein [Thermoanaerobaculales bacterium]